jgi:hypothetical protein
VSLTDVAFCFCFVPGAGHHYLVVPVALAPIRNMQFHLPISVRRGCPFDLVYFVFHWFIFTRFGIFCGHLVYFAAIWYICGHLVHFAAIWYILRPFGIVCGHLVYFVVHWYIFARFGMLYEEKSGNPAPLSPSPSAHIVLREEN